MHSYKENYLNNLTFSLDELTILNTLGEIRLYCQHTPEALASLQKASMTESSESSNRIEGAGRGAAWKKN